MSNQCSGVFDYRSFSLLTPFHPPLKPYSSILRPIFPFHNTLVLPSRRSGSRTSSRPLAAQSSSDIILIATTEHHDGSLVFRFGDACEVVKNEEVVVEIESKAEWESNVVKVLDGDQERQVIVKTIERGYGSDGARLTEVTDGIRNADIGNDFAERETNVISDLRNYHAESSERLSDISVEGVLSLQSVAKMNNSLEGLESTLAETECTAQLDGDESLNPTISLLDNSPNRDKSADHEGTPLKDSGDETEDPSVSVMLETMQVSHIEVTDVKQPYAEDELHKLETEDTSESDMKDLMPTMTMHVSDVEFTDVTNEDVEEGLQDININESIVIDGMPPSDPLGAEPTLDEVSQLQSAHVKLEATMEVSTTIAMDVKDRAVEDELQQVSTNNRDENDVAYVIPAEPILEEEVNQPRSIPVELKPTMKVSDIEVQDATGQKLDDGSLQVINDDASESYIKDLASSSHHLEAQPIQDEGVNHNMLEQCAEADALGSSLLLNQGTHGSLLKAERIESKVSSSELAEASEDSAILLAAEAKVKREEIYLTGYFLSSGAALQEHPSKALTGGDDAYFVAGSKWLGVANGVSKWSFEGTDPGVYAQELMRTCEEIALDTSSVPMSNPVELLCRGVKETNMSGSSNILIANFDDQLVEEYRIELDVGDIVVSATDGLFDNLYEREIAMIVSKLLQAGMKPEEIANALATRAQEVGRSAFVRSPFSDAAQAAGYTGYAGGKPDNVAVIVSLVEKRSNLLAE